MSRLFDAQLSTVSSRVHRLLHDEVIDNTIVVMRELQTAMNQLAATVAAAPDGLSDEDRTSLQTILVPLVSESIREAIHKNELSITNSIIRAKNRILSAIGAGIPDGHEEIDAKVYPNYEW